MDEQRRLFVPQMEGQLCLEDQPKRAPIPVRSNHLGGISAGKWHLVRDRNDHVAICGREHTSVGSFTCKMAPNDSQTPESLIAFLDECGYLCRRCASHA